MKLTTSPMMRRNFIRSSALLAAGLATFGTPAQAHAAPEHFADNDLYMIGPLEGYSPQIGTLVSMLNYNRHTIIQATKNLTVEQLDYLHDAKSNSIGALLMHLGAVDKWYQVNCFEGRTEFSDADKKAWGVALELGEEGRKQLKGKELQYYTDLITEVRNKTLAELKKKDDQWLLALDKNFSPGEKFNNYWKWFHVCEHESNHRGQIAWLKGRMPGAAKTGGE